jgi:hypothetical protein
MEGGSFLVLDIPWLVASVGALVAALAFAAGLGVPRIRPIGFRGIILRWGHAAVWFLLSGTFAAVAVGLGSLAGFLGLLALVCYVTFLVALARVRRDC